MPNGTFIRANKGNQQNNFTLQFFTKNKMVTGTVTVTVTVMITITVTVIITVTKTVRITVTIMVTVTVTVNDVPLLQRCCYGNATVMQRGCNGNATVPLQKRKNYCSNLMLIL